MMPEKRLYIHAGMHKTGTTSIQHALGRNVETLKQAGIISPESGLYPLVRAHHHAVWSLYEHPTHHYDAKHGRFVDLIAEIRQSDYDHFVISSEEFFVCGDAELAKLKAILADDIHPIWIVYIRNPAEWITASWSQRIRLGDSTISLQERIDSEKTNRLENSIKKIATHFGIKNFRLYIYDEVIQTGNLVDHFWQAIDVPARTIPHLVEPERQNVSPSYLTVDLMYHIGQFTNFDSPTMKAKPLTPRYYKWLWEFDEHLLWKYGKIKLRLTPQQRRQIHDLYASGNRKIANAFFQHDRLFLDEIPDKQKPYHAPPQLNRDDLFRLLVFLRERITAYEIDSRAEIKKLRQILNEKPEPSPQQQDSEQLKFDQWIDEFDHQVLKSFEDDTVRLTPEYYTAIERQYERRIEKVRRSISQKIRQFAKDDMHSVPQTLPQLNREDLFRLLAFLAERCIAYELEIQPQLVRLRRKHRGEIE